MDAILFDRSTAQGRLELADRDRLDLLHRMSTNDVNRLAPGEGCATVLTTALARMIDLAVVYHRGDVALLRTHRADTVRAWLARHIFWQDKIKVRDVSAELGQLELHGPGAAIVAGRIAPGAADLRLHHTRNLLGGGFVAAMAPIGSAEWPAFVFIAPVENIPALRESILEADDVREGDAALYEQMRIAAGVPGPAAELTEDYIPLEAGLWDAVSFSKGCYIGQEIIARMESRNKLAKTLVGLRLDAPVAPGARLYAGDSAVGMITSVAQAPNAPGVFVAIGFVKPDSAEMGMALTARAGDESPAAEAPARVVAAPKRA